MNRLLAAIPVFAAAGILAACQTTGDYVDTERPIYQLQDRTVSGQLTYRERIALTPGSTLSVKLVDMSRADAPSVTLAEETRLLDGEQVPLDFALSVKEHELKTNMRYAVRATITDAFGRLAWTTDTVYPVDPTQLKQDLGMLQLVRVAQSDTPATALIGSTWKIENINGAGVVDRSIPTITFASNGTVSGTTGCNNFTGSYTIDGQTIDVGAIALTRRGCIAALADQEQRMVGVVSDLTGWSQDRWGRMVLSTSDRRTLVGIRED